MERLLGLDFGSKTVGVAVSDELGMTACGVTIIRRERENAWKKTIAEIETIAKENQVEKIILGYPRHLDGSEGIRCEKTTAFKEALEKRTGYVVVLWDERLTTVEANEIMMEKGIVDRLERKKYVDQIAASIILQDYMNAQK